MLNSARLLLRVAKLSRIYLCFHFFCNTNINSWFLLASNINCMWEIRSLFTMKCICLCSIFSVIDQWCRRRCWNISFNIITSTIQYEKCSQSTFERISDSVCIEFWRNSNEVKWDRFFLFFMIIELESSLLHVFHFLFIVFKVFILLCSI